MGIFHESPNSMNMLLAGKKNMKRPEIAGGCSSMFQLATFDDTEGCCFMRDSIKWSVILPNIKGI